MAPTISGTQSPPLEATGEDQPMGASSVDTVGQKIEVIKDTEQRKQYFEQEDEGKQPQKQNEKLERKRGPHIMGESMADKFEKIT